MTQFPADSGAALSVPLAIVALAQSSPGETVGYPANRLARCAPELATRATAVRARLLGAPPCPPSAFRIPPIYERAVSALTLNLLWLTREAMAGYGTDFQGDIDRTDVIVGVCGGFDSTLRNALKVAGVAALDDLTSSEIVEKKLLLQGHFGSTTHDKVGEMASIIAARMGLEVGAHGRILALESADATAFMALRTAALGLLSNDADLALVGIGQRFEGAHLALSLSGLLGSDTVLCEGATVLALRRLDTARRDGDRIIAVIDGFAYHQSDCQELGVAPNIGALERLAAALPADRTLAACPASAEALRLPNPESFGLAHTGAAALVAALSELGAQQSLTVLGHSLYGSDWAFRLRGPDAPLAAESIPAAPSREPIAILGLGASYGPFAGRDAVLEAFSEGHDGIRLLSETALPRHTGFNPDKSVPLSAYAERGGELHEKGTEPERDTQDWAQSLAHDVGLEAFSQSCDGVSRAPEKNVRWSVIVASQLCTAAERSSSNAVHAAEIAGLLQRPELAGAASAPTLTGMLPGETAMRLSAELGLGAEIMAVESACASSLAALEIAMRQLRLGLCDAALVVATELPNNLRDLTLCSAQRMLSQERIAPFTEKADGFSPGDGAGAVVLRRASDAIGTGAPILALIRGIGGSSDAVSFTAPAPEGQVFAMRRALQNAEIGPGTVGYVEAHGTGTVRGDRIELEALNTVYGAAPDASDERPGTGLGSVKSMIGHSFAAAGMAGLIRALCAVRGGIFPPTILNGPLHPELGLERGPWEITDHPRPWRAEPHPRRAAVNALGTGGTNFHVILEAPPSVLPESEILCS